MRRTVPLAQSLCVRRMQNNTETGVLSAADEEERWICLCRAGDRQAYGNLVKKYMRSAYFAALGFTGEHEAALDLSQEAFVRAFRAIQRFQIGNRFFTWYYHILRNLCFNYLRDQTHRARPFSEIGEQTIAQIHDPERDPLQCVELEELKERVWQALHRLRPGEREIIVLKDLQHYSYKEIAEILGCPSGTVMSRLYSARQALRRQIEDIEAEYE